MDFENSKADSVEIEGRQFKVDEYGFVSFGDIARGLIGMQSQYASYYVYGKIKGYPYLAEGLRFQGDPANYHDLQIHKDDIEEFVNRVRQHRDWKG